MNLGIYINDLLDSEQLKIINNAVDEVLKNKSVHDVSIFYDNIGFNPDNTKCGMFNSTDLWSFNGNLIVTSLNALSTTLGVVNNINIFYYYGWEKEKNLINLIMSTRGDVKIICRSEKDQKEVYRLTGKNPIGISENFQNIIELLSECKDEHKSNNNNVYQTA
jgi:hypothetical protein